MIKLWILKNRINNKLEKKFHLSDSKQWKKWSRYTNIYKRIVILKYD